LVPITGKSGDGLWWQIVFPGSTSGQGWVSAQPQFSTASNTGNVLIVAAPPPPTSTPTVTFTPSPTPLPAPTPVPPPNDPSQGLKINSFTADHYTILAGDSVKLHWKVQGADSVRLEHDAVSDKVDNDRGDKTYSPAVRYITPKSGAQVAKMGKDEPGFLGCQGANYHGSKIDVKDAPAGTYLCLHTNGDHFAQLYITDTVGPSPGTLKFKFAVWE
jgi:hypothetical protein